MAANTPQNQTRLHLDQYRRLAAIIESRVGLYLPPGKKGLVEYRLQRRAKMLGMNSVGQYCASLLDDTTLDQEFTHLVNALTTNKTDFFRENAHFDFLEQTALPDLQKRLGAGQARQMTVWSAACSCGPEAYSLAMLLHRHSLAQKNFDFQIYGSDIDTNMLVQAERAIYGEDMLSTVPDRFRTAYLLRSRDRVCPTIRVAPEIRRLVKFRQMNLLTPAYPWRTPMDIIFCRNVLIYFNRKTQYAVLKNLCSHLREGGYLFIGHSESLHGLSLPVRPAAPAIYIKP